MTYALEPLLLLIDLLAAWRLTRLVVKDDFPPIKAARDWVLRRWPSDSARYSDAEVVSASNADGEPRAPEDAEYGRLEGTGLEVEWGPEGWEAVNPHWLGKLIDCPWCASVWLSGGVVALRHLTPWWGWVAVVLAIAGAAALIDRHLD